jgi:ubiquinone/menaquinone biosynthesis C-methylase UbiE
MGMGFHTFDPAKAERLEDPSRYEFVSVDELWGMLDPETDDVLLDVGSGTGFYTDELAPAVASVLAVDVQSAMGELYLEKGVPSNVRPVTAITDSLPLRSDSLDGAFSTMTFHEFVSDESFAELRRVLRDGATLALADWSAAGDGRKGPPLDERYDAEGATSLLQDAGFTVRRASDRRETWVVAATR